MAERHRRPPTTSVRGAVGVTLVLALAGVLFVSNARISGGLEARQPQDLAHLVLAEQRRGEALATEVEELRAQVDQLTDAEAPAVPADDQEEALALALAAGRVPVTGPGLVVSLSDASPGAPRPDWVTNDDLVVHQRDLEAVINALWAGGAEAMMLQDQRVTSTSAFRCVGNVLYLHGRVYSPPYVVRAIGDPDELREALDDSPVVQLYRQYVDLVGLGWQVSVEEELELDAYSANLELRHATAPDGVDVMSVVTAP